MGALARELKNKYPRRLAAMKRLFPEMAEDELWELLEDERPRSRRRSRSVPAVGWPELALDERGTGMRTITDAEIERARADLSDEQAKKLLELLENPQAADGFRKALGDRRYSTDRRQRARDGA